MQGGCCCTSNIAGRYKKAKALGRGCTVSLAKCGSDVLVGQKKGGQRVATGFTSPMTKAS